MEVQAEFLQGHREGLDLGQLDFRFLLRLSDVKGTTWPTATIPRHCNSD